MNRKKAFKETTTTTIKCRKITTNAADEIFMTLGSFAVIVVKKKFLVFLIFIINMRLWKNETTFF